MGQSAKFALGLVLIWIGLVAFYFAFHPNGVQLNGNPVSNPSEALKWLIQEFQGVSSGGKPTSESGLF